MVQRLKLFAGIAIPSAVCIAAVVLAVTMNRGAGSVPVPQIMIVVGVALPAAVLAGLRICLLFLSPRARKAAEIGLTITRIGIGVLASALFGCLLITGGIVVMVVGDSWLAGSAAFLLGILVLFFESGRLLRIRRETRESMAATLRKHGFCSHCGYDLRATTDRCPECGQAVPPKRRMPENIEI